MQPTHSPAISIIFLWLAVASAFQPSATPQQKKHQNQQSSVRASTLSVPAPSNSRFTDTHTFKTTTLSSDPAIPLNEQPAFVGQLPLPAASKDHVDRSTKTKHQQPSRSRLGQRWSRRLNTQEDARWVHKTLSASWLVSLLCIASVGAANGFTQVPDSLEIPIWISLACSIFSSINGSQMAMKYRANDPDMKNGFINMALAQVASAISVLYQGPFCPDMLDNYLGNIAMLIPFVPALFITLEEAMTLDTKLEARGLRCKEPSKFDFGKAGDAITATLIVGIPLFMTAFAVPMLMDPARDRTWFLNEMLSGSTEAQAANMYASVFYNLSAGLGSVALTLRDRKLISKWGEQLLAWSMIVPGFVLSFQSLFLLQ